MTSRFDEVRYEWKSQALLVQINDERRETSQIPSIPSAVWYCSRTKPRMTMAARMTACMAAHMSMAARVSMSDRVRMSAEKGMPAGVRMSSKNRVPAGVRVAAQVRKHAQRTTHIRTMIPLPKPLLVLHLLVLMLLVRHHRTIRLAGLVHHARLLPLIHLWRAIGIDQPRRLRSGLEVELCLCKSARGTPA